MVEAPRSVLLHPLLSPGHRCPQGRDYPLTAPPPTPGLRKSGLGWGWRSFPVLRMLKGLGRLESPQVLS